MTTINRTWEKILSRFSSFKDESNYAYRRMRTFKRH